MKHHPPAGGCPRLSVLAAGPALLVLWSALFLIPTAVPSRAAELQVIHRQSLLTATNLVPVRRASRWNRLNLDIGLPLRDRAGLTNLLQQLYDPASTNYHRFLTPDQFAAQFGPTEQDYAAVAAFARTHGLAVTVRHSNRTLLGVRGTLADVERAFHVTINEYQHPTESRTFFAPDREPAIDLKTPVLTVSGLDNYTLPRPCLKPMLAGSAKPNLTGSGPGGTYVGNDFRGAYAPGVILTGAGQKVGLLEFDSGYYQQDITAYETLAGLPNVPVSPVLLDGYNGAGGEGNDEVSLDIEMAISMAPGLDGILVYEGSATDDILNRMATDDLAKQLSASWTYPTDANSDQAFLQMAAQGQSFFNASGDSDAYTGTIPTPADDPNITVVGGTTLTTSGPGGAWVAETVWNWGGGVGGSGGISTVNPIPSWQQGINMATNQGSATMRNLPDVAMAADNVYITYGDGLTGTVGGTSCATPLWAAFTALANQLALTNGQPTVGFINPAVYAMGKGSNLLSYSSLFHDITTGNNESSNSPSRFSAVPGYDLCTGWGTPMGNSLLSALALPEPLRIVPLGNVILTGPLGGPFSLATPTFTLTNHGVSALNWALGNTSTWVNVSPSSGGLVPGGPATTAGISLAPAATNFPAGSYSVPLWFTNLTDGFVQTRQAVLDVVTPPVITTQPANQALLAGMTGTFSVVTGSNALMFYQWQFNGTNLTDTANLSGSATSTLTLTNVTVANVGAYSVILSNAAGVLASSNALLTLVPSPPVVVLQPASQSVLPGAPATFSVATIGTTPYFYQWQYDGTNLTNGGNFSGATSSTLTINHVAPANAGIYSVTVSNSLGSVTSTGAVLSIIPVTAPGMDLSTLWSFTGGYYSGEFIYSPLVQDTAGNFYGTTLEGGFYDYGTVFEWTTNGTLATLLDFNGSDGAYPYGGVLLGKDNYLYGTTYTGTTYGDGNVYKLTSNGSRTVLTVLTTFNGNNGMSPVAHMIQSTDGNFYGTTLAGGAYGYGTVYRMATNGTLTTLVAFDNADGAYPSPVLLQGADGNFYGTTENGGANGVGTIFKMTPSGALTLLYSFTGGNDGAVPVAGLVQGVDGNFYGVAYEGGADGLGTVFRITSSGAFSLLYSFTGASDGATPWGGLMQARDGNLYGTTQSGGTYGFGTVFQLAPTGPLNTLAQFDGFTGANPSAAMIQGADGNLYGTTEAGGSAGDGVLFRLVVGGPLQITGQPVDQSPCVGGTALFTVATSGGTPLTYQWQQDGINLTDGGNISGSATATLSITNVTAADAALYSVVVSSASNSVTSDYAVLEIVFSPPKLTSQPVSQTCLAGTTAAFSVTATGDQPLCYQWRENGTNLADGGNISGSATSTLTLSSVTSANAGNYSVIVSNALFAVSSAKATLTVIAPTSPSAVLTEAHLFADAGGDGAFPYAGLIEGKDNYLYGLAEGGGSHFYGAIFRLSLSGAFNTLYSFANGATGADPYARLTQATNGNFYGVASSGGNYVYYGYDYGALFKMTTNYAVTGLYSFTGGADGENPETGLTQGADGNFYGASTEGGDYAFGSLYQMTPTGSVTPLYEFTGENDGEYPLADLVSGLDGKLYGTTVEAGPDGLGTVFSLTTNGTFATLAAFSDFNGAYPEAGLIQGADGKFYGTTLEGGIYGYGTAFSLTTNGVLTTLCSFANTNGSGPAATLVQASDGNLYGTCSAGGAGGQGTVFRLATNGALTTLVWFDGLNGANPQAALVQASDGSFYGTTPLGGMGYNLTAGGGYGTVFHLIIPIFTNRQFTVASAIACLPYSGTLVGQAIAPAGDTLSYAKVSGPAWLLVATNGLLSGTPTNSDIGTNAFVVSLTDTNGLSASAAMNILVAADPPPAFLSNPFSEPWANLAENYAGDIATNGTAPYLNAGDLLTFAKVSGPAWLRVAANGTLSGIPDVPSAGANSFVVSVTDLGGASNTAALFIYVNSPPEFSPQFFSKPPATVGVPYSGFIATNAFDPDIPAGDVLTFYKVSGPAWLTVATSGALSGLPTSADVGPENWLMLVVDSGGLAGVGSMTIAVNPDQPPQFFANPFSEPPAIAGQSYSATMATNAFDPIAGDQLTFSKISGPAWLSVAASGSLSGLPLSTNAGANSFVVSVQDLGGLSTNATMLINITAVPMMLSISQQGTNVLLEWSGGVPPYQVLSATNPGAGWQNTGLPTSQTNLMLIPSNPAVFYRVQGR